MSIQLEINKLLKYGLKNRLIQEDDFYYVANKIIALLDLKVFEKVEIKEEIDFYQTIDSIINYAFESGIIKSNKVVYRDLFDSQLMNCLMPRPSEINQSFWSLYKKNPKCATNYFYKLSRKSNYIRVKRTQKNIRWKSDTQFGELDITINLSKPEKDPQSISRALKMPKLSYPKCLLCRENEGLRGHLNHPALITIVSSN